MSSPSIFTRIINGEIPGQFVYQDEQVVAIRDIKPQAPVHILIIPRQPIMNVYEVTEAHSAIMAALMIAAAKIVAQEGLTNGFRLLINNGPDAHQEVMHLHMHLLAGGNIGPMTCRD
jgi:histidine triad (HIT) family protein